MFSRKDLTDDRPQGPSVAAEPVSATDVAELPRWQRPSSFASRKAQAEENNRILGERRLVSLGEVEFTQRDRRTGEIEVTPAKLYYDRDKPADRWVEIDGVPGRIALNDGGEPEKVTKLPPLKQRTSGPSALTERAAPGRVWTP